MKKYVVVLSLVITMLFALVACGENDDTTYTNDNDLEMSNQIILQESHSEEKEQPIQGDNDGIFHRFPSLGFSIVFPATWEGRFGLAEYHSDYWGTIVSVYHIATREEMDTGWLWSFRRVHEDNFVYDEEPTPHPHAIMYQGGGYAFIIQMPTDVQWDYETPDGELAIEYLEMADQWEEIASSFRLMDSR